MPPSLKRLAPESKEGLRGIWAVRGDYRSKVFNWRNLKIKNKNMKLTPNQIHDAKYYYSVFSSIPEELWGKGKLVHRPECQIQINGVFVSEMRCALGQLSKLNMPSTNLTQIFRDFDKSTIPAVNDSARFASAKQNILTKLQEIIDSQ